ncbi:FAD-dependent monooxygenase [Streptacidiphilus sp. EB129]|uniref:FAD-dependent monooxygenase n=1 Tax=Streptacidiphilus sp. EB129 TaxID=3156262 RepID=UPI003515D43D
MSAVPSAQSVIVVGAGPTGLTLACELATAGVSCTVLERRAAPSPESRAIGLYSRTMELLSLRGHAEALAALGRPVGRLAVGRGAGVDFAELDSPFPYLNALPQSSVEVLLQQHALDLGVTIERQAEVYDLSQDGLGVTLKVRTPHGEWEESADYVVGCDGAHSAVRDFAGIAFRGRTYDMAPILADVRLRKAPPQDLVLIPSRGGILLSMPYGDGWYRIAVAHRDNPWSREPVTLTELRSLMLEALGFDPEPYDPKWITRFKIHQRIADQYRTGRVLLAGDAAHLHSPLGGQGLNLGIQDAVNLGWKLAAEVQGWAPTGLLDSYEAEQRPYAQRVLRATDRATRFATSTSNLAFTLRRSVLPKLLGIRPVRQFAEESLSGLRNHYAADGPVGGSCSGKSELPLRTGMRVPDLLLSMRGSAPVRLYDLLRDGRLLLVDFEPDGRAANRADAWGNRVNTVVATSPTLGLDGVTTLLVRPDGYVAWVDGTAAPDRRVERVGEALLRWCGVAEYATPGLATVLSLPHLVAAGASADTVTETPTDDLTPQPSA